MPTNSPYSYTRPPQRRGYTPSAPSGPSGYTPSGVSIVPPPGNNFEGAVTAAKTRFLGAQGKAPVIVADEEYSPTGPAPRRQSPSSPMPSRTGDSPSIVPMSPSAPVPPPMMPSAARENANQARTNAKFATDATQRPNLPTGGGLLAAGESTVREMWHNKAKGDTEAFHALGQKWGFNAQKYLDKWHAEGTLYQKDFPQPGQFKSGPPMSTPTGPRGPDNFSGAYQTPSGGVVVDANGRKVRDVPMTPSSPTLSPVMGPQPGYTPAIEMRMPMTPPRTEAQLVDVTQRRQDYAMSENSRANQLEKDFTPMTPPAPAAPEPPSVQAAKIHQQTVQGQTEAANSRFDRTQTYKEKQDAAKAAAAAKPPADKPPTLAEKHHAILSIQAQGGKNPDGTFTRSLEESALIFQGIQAAMDKMKTGTGTAQPLTGAGAGGTTIGGRAGPTNRPAETPNTPSTQQTFPPEAAAKGFRDAGDGTAIAPDGKRYRNVRVENGRLVADLAG